MKGTRILALALALIMVLALVPTAMAEDEPIKISVAGYMFGPIDNEKDVITPAVEKMLKEKHGINVDIEVVYIEQANYGELLNTRLSGGTAPYVFLAQSTTTLSSRPGTRNSSRRMPRTSTTSLWAAPPTATWPMTWKPGRRPPCGTAK